jgi:hypothetical protein
LVTAEEVRRVALELPGSYLTVVRDVLKVKVNQYVYIAFDEDELGMGIGFPKEERDAAIEAEPHKFSLPAPRDLRYNWIEVRLSELDAVEMRELVTDAWRLCVSKKRAAEYDAQVARGN